MLPARAVSAFGDDMALLALTLRVYEQGHGPWAITALLACSAVPIALLAAAAGRVVDALPFRSLAVGASVWQAACCAGLAFATPLWCTCLLVLALQTGQVVAGPTWQAMLPAIAEEDELGRAVGASQALTTLASVAAPAVAGVSVGLLGYAAPLLIDASTFLVLGAVGVAVRATRPGRRQGAPPEGTGVSVVRYSLRADALLWPLIVGLCGLVLVGEVTNVVEVFLVRGTLGASSVTFGLVAAVLAAAIVGGALVAGRGAADSVRALRTTVAALGLALALVFAGLAPTLAVFAVAWALVGIANGIVNVDVSTLVLRRTPERCRGQALARVSGMVRTASLGALAIGGLAGALVGPRVTFVTAGLLMAAVATALLARAQRFRHEPSPFRASSEPDTTVS